MTLGQQMYSIRQQVVRHTNTEYTSQLSYVESRIQRAQASLVELERQHQQLRIYLLREQQQEHDPGAREDIVFTNLLRMPQIKDIVFEDRLLVVTTHEIVVTYKRKKYPIGEFKIKINFPDGYTIFENITRKIGEYDHPHVYNGSACYGNIYSEISRCLSTCEVGVLIPLLIQFLESVTEGDWYTHVDRWTEENKTEENTVNE